MDHFKLLDFGSFFALFAALNLAYAGSKQFRMALNKDILKLDDKVYEYYLRIEQLSNVHYDTDNEQQRNLYVRLQDISIDYVQNLITEYEEFRENRKPYGIFKKYYRRMFLSSAFFCVLVLILVGFESDFKEQVEIILLYSHLIAITLIIYIFISGCVSSKSGNLYWRKADTIHVVLITAIVYIIGCSASFSTNHCDFLREQLSLKLVIGVWVSIVIAILPYLLYFVKGYLYRKKNKELAADYEIKLAEDAADVYEKMSFEVLRSKFQQEKPE